MNCGGFNRCEAQYIHANSGNSIPYTHTRDTAMSTIVCTNCGRHTPVRSAGCRHCGHDAYADRSAGHIADRTIDRAFRNTRTVLYVLLLPVAGFAGQMLVGAMILMPFFFIAGLTGGVGDTGPTDLMNGLTSFVFGIPGLLVTIAFVVISLYRRFERVRAIVHRRGSSE